MNKLLFKVRRKELDIAFFRAGGKGGQHQNKTSSACRIRHKASGAVGESREERSQHANRKIAFRRMANSKKFQNWVKAQAAAVLQGYRDAEDKVDKSIALPQNLKVEYVTTYSCDRCGRTETVVSDRPNVIPDWVIEIKDEEDDDKHHCTNCDS